MKILFFDSNYAYIYGLPYGFMDLGHEVRVSGSITQQDVPAILTEWKPNLVMTMGWGEMQQHTMPECISTNCKQMGIPLVYWATEDPIYTMSFSFPLVRRMIPDFVFTLSRKHVDFYRQQGLKAENLDFGFHPQVHQWVDPEPEYSASVALVANAYADLLPVRPELYRWESLRVLVQPLLEAGIRVDFWGSKWDEMRSFFGRDIPKEWIHGFLPYINANKVYSSADIILAVQNDTEVVTQRTFEIMGSGGFLLTSNTPEVRRLFSVNSDLVASSSGEQTVELVNYYLDHSEERNKIKKQGRVSVAPYSYVNRAQNIVDTLRQYGLLRDE